MPEVRDAPGSNRIEVPAGMSSRNPRAAARSNSRPELASGRCRWEPTWIGRSAVLVKVRSPRSSGPRSALISSFPGLTRIAPGPAVDTPAIGVSSPLLDRLVQRDELAAVGKGRLDL